MIFIFIGREEYFLKRILYEDEFLIEHPSKENYSYSRAEVVFEEDGLIRPMTEEEKVENNRRKEAWNKRRIEKNRYIAKKLLSDSYDWYCRFITEYDVDQEYKPCEYGGNCNMFCKKFIECKGELVNEII